MNAMVPMQAVEASELLMVEGGGKFDALRGIFSDAVVDAINSKWDKEQQGGNTTNQGGTGNININGNGNTVNTGCGCPHPA